MVKPQVHALAIASTASRKQATSPATATKYRDDVTGNISVSKTDFLSSNLSPCANFLVL